MSHTHPSHTPNSRLLTSSLSFGVPGPHTTQCVMKQGRGMKDREERSRGMETLIPESLDKMIFGKMRTHTLKTCTPTHTHTNKDTHTHTHTHTRSHQNLDFRVCFHPSEKRSLIFFLTFFLSRVALHKCPVPTVAALLNASGTEDSHRYTGKQSDEGSVVTSRDTTAPENEVHSSDHTNRKTNRFKEMSGTKQTGGKGRPRKTSSLMRRK